jgi:hypothetical protein
MLLEGAFLPKDGISVTVDPILAPGQFRFEAVRAT